MACPQGLVAFQYGAREVFFGGRARGSECLVEVKELRFISTEKVCFYGGGTFLRRKCISIKEVNLKAIGVSLVWKRGTNARRR